MVTNEFAHEFVDVFQANSDSDAQAGQWKPDWLLGLPRTCLLISDDFHVFWHDKMLQAHIVNFCPRPVITHFFKEMPFLLAGNGIRGHSLSPQDAHRYHHCHCSSVFPEGRVRKIRTF